VLYFLSLKTDTTRNLYQAATHQNFHISIGSHIFIF